jgi:alpha-L-fucosidase
MGMAEHHDNFALWDSAATPFNARKMGPHRDIVGDLSAAVRRQGLRYGVSNHGVENFTFVNPPPELRARLEAARADLFDPAWAAFYNVADRSDAAMTRFLTDWVNRNIELIDKYQPDILWFDNGANLRLLDPLKLRIAAYYYNRALEWHKEVSLSTKFNAYAPSNDDTKQIGSIVDFEKVSVRSPAGIRPGPWMVDDPISGSSWSYTEGMRLASAEAIVGRLIDTVSKGGFYLFNGSIYPECETVLDELAKWMPINGEAIFGTRPWTKCLETGPKGSPSYHFTTKGGTLYAIASAWPAGDAVVESLAAGSPAGKAASVTLLGHSGELEFAQDEQGLKVKLPAQPSGGPAWVLKIAGLKVP